MLGQGLSLDIDLDALADIVDDSTPWLEAWAALLAIAVSLAVLSAARQFIRERHNPVRQLMRRRAR